MSEAIRQKIFRYSAVDRLRDELRSGESLKDYFRETYAVRDSDVLPSSIALAGKRPALKVPAKNPVSADFDNATALYEYLAGIDETQASDARLWTHLSHVDFRKYSLGRWGVGDRALVMKDEVSRQRAINQILQHWFVDPTDRGLRRNGLARLWWAVHLTKSPWEKDPEYFGNLSGDNLYRLTRALFLTQDIYQQVLERGMGRSHRILISMLEYLDQNPDFAQSREKVRGLAKELNLIYGVKKVIVLNRESLKALISKIGAEVGATIQE